MRLFRARKEEPSDAADLQELQASVALVRRRLSNARMPLGELFKLMGEDERAIMAAMPARSPLAPESRDDLPETSRPPQP